MWEINLNDQIGSFFYSILLGIILCIYYDFLRSVCKVCKKSFLVNFFADIIFWVTSAFAIFIFLLARTNGELRGYVFAGNVLGFTFLRITFSRFLILLFSVILSKISSFFAYLSKIFNNAYSKSERFIIEIWLFLIKKIKMLLKSVKKLLKNKGEMLYTVKDNTEMEY